jgi:hypothetical protein
VQNCDKCPRCILQVVNRCSCSQPIVWQASHLLHRYRLTGISMQECSSLCMFRNFHCSSSLLLNKDTSVRICTCNCKGMSPFSREKQTWRRGARASRVREGSSAEGGNIEGSGSLGCEEVGEANYADLFKASFLSKTMVSIRKLTRARSSYLSDRDQQPGPTELIPGVPSQGSRRTQAAWPPQGLARRQGWIRDVRAVVMAG